MAARRRVPTREAAKCEILALYREWRPRYPMDDNMLFFAFLQNHHPELLTFRSRQDRWQDVHAWINQASLPNEDRKARRRE